MADAYICEGFRTPIGRLGGALSPVRTDDLAAIPLRAIAEACPGTDWDALDDAILGCANQAGEDNRNVARMALLLADYPVSAPGATINRLCGSGLDAVSVAARAIKAGEADLMIAGGVESMSRSPYVVSKAPSAFSRVQTFEDTTIGWRLVNPLMDAKYGVDSMPRTADNVAADYGISREAQDAFAARSQARTKAAQEKGRLAAEITPVDITGRKGAVTRVDTDEHPRPGTSFEALQALRPLHPDIGGSVTAGNASGVNDGACALVIASEKAITKYGLNPKARLLGAATAGVEPRIMGIGPAPATLRLLDRLGMTRSDIDLYELNEAFASQALAVLGELGLPGDADHVNPNGGAIALGHPLGMSGARLALTAATEFAHTPEFKTAICTMCIGVGQGIALAMERV